MTYHVLPINDTNEHEESSACECQPELQMQENGNMLIIHNSFDGREIIEELLDELNNESE
jgi:hypothetical protein